jgi:YegS/Rv2252/BmrU family lipid kinase
MHVLVIRNPVSGSRHLRVARRDVEETLSRLGATVTWRDTVEGSVEHLELLRRESFDRVLVLGGDGTIREVAQILVERKLRTPIAMLPQGSGNILASALGMPRFPLRCALEFAVRGTPRPMDVMRVNDRYIALFGVGQGNDVVFIEGTSRTLKHHVGIVAYALSLLRTFLWSVPHRYHVVVDGKRHRVLGKLVLALNVFAIGPLPILEAISPWDGRIDVLILSPRSLLDLLLAALSILLRHPLHRIPSLQVLSGCRISIAQVKGRRIQLDGDVLPGRNLQIEVIPRALHVVCSKGAGKP